MANQQIFMLATAHLDTQWNWTVRDTVVQYLPDTLRKNFTLFQSFPNYRFNFEGAYRYALMQEYYPADFEQVKRWHQIGRWNLAGAMWESPDVLVPSSESIIRQILYGSEFYQQHFGSAPRDIFLPDCFGFGFNLPTIARHMGLIGFSTQKLHWNKAAAQPIPFAIGKWHGSDGNFIYAVLDPGIYETKIEGPLRQHPEIREQLMRSDGISVRYYGTGDIGGAPDAESVRNLEQDLGVKSGIEVLSASPEEAYQAMNQRELPSYAGELLLRRHGVGCYTARAIMKRWNAQAERMADAAERINVLAAVLGYRYPQHEIDTAWKRVLAHQFHDDITGTSIPEAYAISYNDLILSLNQLSEELIGGVRNVSGHMDTTGPGVPILIYNPVAFERQEVVQLRVPEGDYKVYQGEQEVVSQQDGDRLQFLAQVDGTGLRVYHVAAGASEAKGRLKYRFHEQHILENQHYRVKVNTEGDIISIRDLDLDLELLVAPIRLVQFANHSKVWPAWEIRYADLAEPEEMQFKHTEIELVEQGPVRLVLEVRRDLGHSNFIQRIVLAHGIKRVEIEHQIDWLEQAKLLKLEFPLSLEPELAGYDCGAGLVYRGVNKPNLYEVPAQDFVTLSDEKHTISLMSDCKYGWDRPEKHRMRLSLIHTPEGSFGPAKQDLADLGEHRFMVAITSHAGNFEMASVEAAQAFRQGMSSFYTEPHAGELGDHISLISSSDPGLKVMAVKQAQSGSKIVVRVQDVSGRSHADRRLNFVGRVMTAHETNGLEELIPGRVMIEGHSIRFDLNRNAIKSFVISLEAPEHAELQLKQQPVNLLFNSDAYSPEGSQKILTRFPMELMSDEIHSRGIGFKIDASKVYSTMYCEGQKVIVPDGYRELVFLAAGLEGDKTVEFIVDGRKRQLTIPDWREPIGDWDDFAGQRYGGIKSVPVAFQASHLHAPEGNLAFEYGYMFRFSLQGKKIFFPHDRSIAVFAATALQAPDVEAADVMYDQREARPTFTLEVIGGQGSGEYPLHAPLRLKPEVPLGQAFVGWEPEFCRMPVGDETVQAIFKPLGIDLAQTAEFSCSSPNLTPEAGWSWAAEGDKWLEVDLGEIRRVNRYHVRHAGSAGLNERWNTRDFEFQAKVDGVWKSLDQVQSNQADYTLGQIEAISAQQFRLLITRAAQFSNDQARIMGLELYGSEHV